MSDLSVWPTEDEVLERFSAKERLAVRRMLAAIEREAAAKALEDAEVHLAQVRATASADVAEAQVQVAAAEEAVLNARFVLSQFIADREVAEEATEAARVVLANAISAYDAAVLFLTVLSNPGNGTGNGGGTGTPAMSLIQVRSPETAT